MDFVEAVLLLHEDLIVSFIPRLSPNSGEYAILDFCRQLYTIKAWSLHGKRN